MSRVQAGSVVPHLDNVSLDEVVQAALVGIPTESVQVELPEDLPAARVDSGLVERAVHNIVETAASHNPPGAPVRVCASAIRNRIELRVVDRGPGVPDEAKKRIFEPFQRTSEGDQSDGTGLGLAVARGFADVVGGSLHAEDTPGGGLTMVLSLPSAPSAPSPTS